MTITKEEMQAVLQHLNLTQAEFDAACEAGYKKIQERKERDNKRRREKQEEQMRLVIDAMITLD